MSARGGRYGEVGPKERPLGTSVWKELEDPEQFFVLFCFMANTFSHTPTRKIHILTINHSLSLPNCELRPICFVYKQFTTGILLQEQKTNRNGTNVKKSAHLWIEKGKKKMKAGRGRE